MSAREDGYVECTECGHPLEQHGTAGCLALGWQPTCRCPTRWTKAAIAEARQREGLPGRWSTP